MRLRVCLQIMFVPPNNCLRVFFFLVVLLPSTIAGHLYFPHPCANLLEIRDSRLPQADQVPVGSLPIFNTGIRARTTGSFIRHHVHYQLVLDTVGFPLTIFSSTWELVKAVTCALTCRFLLLFDGNEFLTIITSSF